MDESERKGRELIRVFARALRRLVKEGEPIPEGWRKAIREGLAAKRGLKTLNEDRDLKIAREMWRAALTGERGGVTSCAERLAEEHGGRDGFNASTIFGIYKKYRPAVIAEELLGELWPEPIPQETEADSTRHAAETEHWMKHGWQEEQDKYDAAVKMWRAGGTSYKAIAEALSLPVLDVMVVIAKRGG